MTVASNHAQLTLDRTGLPLENLSALLSSDGGNTQTFPVVTGVLRRQVMAKRAMTLFNARLLSLPPGGVELSAQAATLGIASVTADAFDEARVQLDWLQSWLEPPPLPGRWLGRDEPLSLDLRDIPLCQAQLPGVRIDFVASHSYSTSEFQVEVGRETQARLYFDEPTTRDDAVSWVRKLQDLLIVAIGVPASVTALHLLPTGTDPPGGFVTLISQLNQRPAEEKPSRAALLSYTSKMLLPGAVFKSTCSTFVRDWFKIDEKHSDAIIRLNAPKYAQFMYIDNICALVAQAIESMFGSLTFSNRELSRSDHSKRVESLLSVLNEEKEDSLSRDDLTWARNILTSRNEKKFADKVTDLLDSTGPLKGALQVQLPKLASDIEDMRNTVSHGGKAPSKSGPSIRDTPEYRYFLTEVATWIVRVVLLLEAGHADAARLACENADLQFAIDRLQQMTISAEARTT